MADRKLSITITGDAKSANKALDSLNKGLGKTEKASSGLSDGIKSGLAIGGVAAIGAFAKSSIDAASDLSESVSKTKVVFGDASASVLAFGKDAADSMGMSEQEALSAAGTFGNLLRSIGMTEKESAKMSTSMVDLSADLASFNNVPTAEALEAIRAGLVGETEPLKKFGVNLDEASLKAKALEMGLSDGKATLDANAKSQAAYALIMEQTTLAQGDFERTSDGLANQQKILAANFNDAKASLGEGLMPAMQTAVTVAGGALDAFTALPPAIQQTVVLGGAGAIAWAQWGDGIKGAAKKAKDFTSTLGKVGAFAGPAAAGLAILGAAYVAFQSQNEKAKQRVEEWNASVKEMRDEAISTGRTLDEVFASGKLRDWATENRDAIAEAGIDLGELESKLGGTGAEWIAYWGEVSKGADLDPNDKFSRSLFGLPAQLNAAKASAKDFKATSTELGIGLDGATESTEALGGATDATKEKFDAVKTAIDEAAQGVRDYYSATTSGLENTIAFEASLDAFTESVKGQVTELGAAGRSLDITTEAGRKNTQGLIEMKNRAVESAAAIAQQTGNSQAGAFALTGYANQLRDSARAAGYSEEEIELMIRQMKLTPTDIKTTFADNAKSVEAKVRDLNNEISRVKSYVPIRIDMRREGAVPRAEGGPVRAGMPYLVGERGPELITAPFNGMVHDAQKTQRMLSGGGSSVGGAVGGDVHIHIHAGMLGSEQQVISWVAKGLRDAQARAGSRKILAGTA